MKVLSELEEIKAMLAGYDKDAIPHLASDIGLGRYIKKADKITIIREIRLVMKNCPKNNR